MLFKTGSSLNKRILYRSIISLLQKRKNTEIPFTDSIYTYIFAEEKRNLFFFLYEKLEIQVSYLSFFSIPGFIRSIRATKTYLQYAEYSEYKYCMSCISSFSKCLPSYIYYIILNERWRISCRSNHTRKTFVLGLTSCKARLKSKA